MKFQPRVTLKAGLCAITAEHISFSRILCRPDVTFHRFPANLMKNSLMVNAFPARRNKSAEIWVTMQTNPLLGAHSI